MERLQRWLGESILWLFAVGPGLLIITYGANGISNERLVAVGFPRLKRVVHADDAVGWGWILIGIGFWALGKLCYLKTGKPVVKVLGWALAAVASLIGIVVLLRQFD